MARRPLRTTRKLSKLLPIFLILVKKTIFPKILIHSADTLIIRIFLGGFDVGTPCWRVFCIGLCVVAFCHSALPAETDEINKPTSAQPTSAQPTSAQPTSAQPTSAQPTSAQPTPAQLAPAQKTTADGPSRGHKNDAGPTLPNPVEPKSSKKKMDSDAKAATDNVTESPSDQTDSPPSDQPIIDDETPQFIDDVPLVTENILLAPEPYEPTCKSRGRCTKQCRQCCQCDCSRCGCDYDTYLLVDFSFLQAK